MKYFVEEEYGILNSDRIDDYEVRVIDEEKFLLFLLKFA